MQDNEMKSDHGAQFIAARDSRNRKIPGLQIRNGKYYGYLWTETESGKRTPRRFPLSNEGDGLPCSNIAEAKTALEILRDDRRENKLPAPGQKPGFTSWKAQYLELQSSLSKKGRTRSVEKEALARWAGHLGNVRLDRILTPAIKSFIEKRLAGKLKVDGKTFGAAAPRTVQLDVIALRNCLKQAIEAGHLRELPRFPKIKVPPPPRRALITPEEFNALLAACVATSKDGQPVTKNGEQLRDFLRFLAFCGCREKEGLRVRWGHVDFENRRVFIGASEDFVTAAMTVGTGGTSKNRGSRVVDFNPQLESLLVEMKARRAPDSSWLFPSPQRGKKDVPARSLRESLRLVRTHAKLPSVGFHDLRHLFCSFCVMAGIDFMTIAAWLGHKDGGILIGKVYGHLLDDHRQKMAAKLVIGSA